ncbi:MAG: hypothetical protein HOJ22_09840 [Chloroflexi bacterium]|jgi:hypothetical protein|nr:hypothetical protein [Chloroflexota bacterium]MBT5628583.1 hypothetical protein [Chloroflexota bacterium]
MSERNPVTSADLLTAAELCVDSLRRLDTELWNKLAYGLEWTRSKTAAHIADSLDFYSGDLAMRVQEHLESAGLHYQEGTVEGAAGQIDFSAAALARIAESTPAGVRAFHPTGMADAEAFLAMGCVEILMHGHDSVVGTEAEFDPDNELCQRILGRLFPWAPLDTPGWLTLLWATGRGELDGQEFLGESWVWHNDLLSEWEGNIPRSQAWVDRQ